MNRTLQRSSLLASALVLALPSLAAAQLGRNDAPIPVPQADLFLTNGHIYTPTGWVTDLAVANGVIVAVGTPATVAPAKGPKTRVLDLHGQTVLPGLHDMHVHPLPAGLAELNCKIEPTSNLKQALASVAACVKTKKPGEWVVGRAYEPSALGVTPTKEMLDSVAPNNPVLLTDVSIHSSWANSAALKIAGITRDTPTPQGGIIEHDAKGEPTGVFRETANGLVSSKVPPSTRQENAKALRWSLDKMLSYGITGFEDALVTREAAQAYADISDEGGLKQTVRGCLIGADPALVSLRQVYARARFSPSCLKIFTDGVPTDSHTAAMLDDYVPSKSADAHGTGHDRGMLMIPPEELKKQLVDYDAMGLTVKLHAAGDAAVHESLEAIAAARGAHGYSGLNHEVAHASFVALDDIRRAREIGAVLEFSPYIWSPSPIIDSIVPAVGEERMKRWIPFKDALDAGVFVVAGSDWAVVPSVNPWAAIETLVTRKEPGGAGTPVGIAEAITLKQAIDIFTVNAARQLHVGDASGTIEKGKRADLVVIDRDIFAVPVTTVHDTQVRMTIIDGKVAYENTARQP